MATGSSDDVTDIKIGGKTRYLTIDSTGRKAASPGGH